MQIVGITVFFFYYDKIEAVVFELEAGGGAGGTACPLSFSKNKKSG